MGEHSSATGPPPPVTPGRVIAASVVLFALSLPLPALWEGSGAAHQVERGAVLVATGVFGILIGQVGWFANLFWTAGVVLLSRRRWKASAVVASLAVLVAADSFMLHRTGIPSDSGGTRPVRLAAGFYVWWGSQWMLAAGALLLRRRRPAETAGVREVPA